METTEGLVPKHPQALKCQRDDREHETGQQSVN
ncbi:hypothetical protein ACP_0281 [Acidobacterium capsulatum ATCC 51196]|uniref:Uncharacterized protein n=1 Tax=Acidobacterium capsulatum (strain ATCC 51196 / DSM 11244 / BCRC 80197 / JCM 7670 / NBRC 15755 / NCIMB 13165 / 161) TaxID=240015 RepID=C1F9C7_ACIC5|nr:hypothetical protein ACP_0281 [Acidobacterium capsulatum ATCC 51196]